MPTEAHEYAELFPLHEGQTLVDLSEDIKKNGVIEAIVMYEGKILDGRRRELACESVNVKPRYRAFGSLESDGDDPLAFVWSKNFHRRHLNPNEKALSAAQYVTASAGRPKQSTDESEKKPITRVEAAEKFDVSIDALKRARTISEGGSQSLVDAVQKEELSISDAASVAGLPKSIQNKAVSRVRSGDASTVREAARQLSDETSEAALEEEANPTDETIGDQIKRVNAEIESFCRKMLKMFDDECPRDPWIVEEGTIDGARKKVQNACQTLRTAKCEAECPKCDGTGCAKCFKTGRMPKFVLDQLGTSK
jgi:ParB-like chromosome segregation protein Spo0J